MRRCGPSVMSSGDEDAVDVERVARAVSAARDAIAARGGAKLGDKTMMDVLIPFAERVEAMAAAGTLDLAAWAMRAVAFAGEAAELLRPSSPRSGGRGPLPSAASALRIAVEPCRCR